MKEIDKNKKSIGKLKPLSKDASPINKWKFKISQKIAEFRVARGLSLEELSILLEVDKGNIRRIMNGHIEKVTLDKLLAYIEIILIVSKDKNSSNKFHDSADKFFEFEDLKFA